MAGQETVCVAAFPRVKCCDKETDGATAAVVDVGDEKQSTFFLRTEDEKDELTLAIALGQVTRAFALFPYVGSCSGSSRAALYLLLIRGDAPVENQAVYSYLTAGTGGGNLVLGPVLDLPCYEDDKRTWWLYIRVVKHAELHEGAAVQLSDNDRHFLLGGDSGARAVEGNAGGVWYFGRLPGDVNKGNPKVLPMTSAVAVRYCFPVHKLAKEVLLATKFFHSLHVAPNFVQHPRYTSILQFVNSCDRTFSKPTAWARKNFIRQLMAGTGTGRKRATGEHTYRAACDLLVRTLLTRPFGSNNSIVCFPGVAPVAESVAAGPKGKRAKGGGQGEGPSAGALGGVQYTVLSGQGGGRAWARGVRGPHDHLGAAHTPSSNVLSRSSVVRRGRRACGPAPGTLAVLLATFPRIY